MNSKESHKTAIARKKLSAPAQYLVEHDLLMGRCLDFGCGHGVDAEILDIDKFDTHFFPARPWARGVSYAWWPWERKVYDTIMCNYVLNVVSEKEAAGIIEFLEHLLKPNGHAYFAVRRDMSHADMTRQRLVELDLPVLAENASFCIYETWK